VGSICMVLLLPDQKPCIIKVICLKVLGSPVHEGPTIKPESLHKPVGLGNSCVMFGGSKFEKLMNYLELVVLSTVN
jgi:hypothetical protein